MPHRPHVPLLSLLLFTVGCSEDPTSNEEAGAQTESTGADAEPTMGTAAEAGDGTQGDGGVSTDADSSNGTSTNSDSGEDTSGDAECSRADVPMEQAALVAWLEAGDYRDWIGEPAPHASTGPHFGSVRTFVDACLADSLDAGAAEHPVGAASVKELYGNGDSVRGWAVMVKVAADAADDGWYWFEIYDGSIYADAVGPALCTNCHAGGSDYFLSPWPF